MFHQAKQACSIYQYILSPRQCLGNSFTENLHPRGGAAALLLLLLLPGSTAAVTTRRLTHMQKHRPQKSAAQKHLAKAGMNAKEAPKRRTAVPNQNAACSKLANGVVVFAHICSRLDEAWPAGVRSGGSRATHSNHMSVPPIGWLQRQDCPPDLPKPPKPPPAYMQATRANFATAPAAASFAQTQPQHTDSPATPTNSMHYHQPHMTQRCRLLPPQNQM